MPARKHKSNERQLSLFVVEEHPLFDEIRQMKLEEMTPLAAMQELSRIREQLDR